METYVYYLLFIVIIVISYFIYLSIKKQKIQSSNQSKKIDQILSLLDKENIINVEYIRNKIVISFKDVSKFDASKLLENGVKGVNIIGDKVKFYIDEDNTENEESFLIIKNYIERK